MNESFAAKIDIQMVESFIATRQEEHLGLEFKTAGADLTSGGDKKNFAEIVSGFANSAGGVVVWGVVTQKDPVSGVDVATAESPFANAAKFRRRLEELTTQVVSPIVPGVTHREISRDDGSGFVVTFVPESLSGPHMALAGHQRYFKRAVDRFYRMEHFDVADMFGRRLRAEVELERRFEDGGSDNEGWYVRVALSIRNDGRAAAIAPFVYVTISKSPTRLEQRGLSQHTRSDDGLMRTVALSRSGPATITSMGFVGLRDLVIPPGPAVDVGVVIVTFPKEQRIPERNVLLQYGAENASLKSAVITVGEKEVQQLRPEWYRPPN